MSDIQLNTNDFKISVVLVQFSLEHIKNGNAVLKKFVGSEGEGTDIPGCVDEGGC